MLELIAGVAVAFAALAIVLEPLIRNRPDLPPGPRDDADEDYTPLEESESPKVQALLALKEIEFDRATGKLSDDDYEQLKARYAKLALAAIAAEETATTAVATAEATDDPAEALIRAARDQTSVCPVCGPRPETGAAFCSECGRPLGV
jgi:formate dehydrogenase maturation protein FdhE